MRFSRYGGALAATIALAFFGPRPAFASVDDAVTQGKATVGEVEGETSKLKTQVENREPYDAARLVAEGELYLRSGQPAEAVKVLELVVELSMAGRAPKASEAQARFLLGEAFVKTNELYSARREFEYVAEHIGDSTYQKFAGKVASRLVDVSLRLGRTEDLPGVLAKLENLARFASGDSMAYAKAKVLLAMGRSSEALGAAEKITGNSIYAQRGAYLKGVALMKIAREQAVGKPGAAADYRAAIASFDVGTVPATDAEAKDVTRIAELSLLAMARLHFEQSRFLQAARGYERIPRTSQYFSEALYELSWTYVRMGDYERGGRTLDALRVLDPGLINGADAALLRADLLLRAGRFADAEKAYEAARAEYDPLRQQVREFLKEHVDPAIYYDRLTGSSIETGTELSPGVVLWAREEARGDRVFAIVDDVARSRALVKDSFKRVALMRSALGGPTRAKAFPSLRRELEVVIGLQNRLSQVRATLGRGIDSEASSGSAELEQARGERRRIMARAAAAPSNPAEFQVREVEIERKWNSVSQELQKLELLADHFNAKVNALRAMLRNAERHGVTASPDAIERYKQELLESEKDMQVNRAKIASYRESVELGRAASGFGDDRFVEDDQARATLKTALAREVSLSGSDGKIAPSVGRLGEALRLVDTADARLEQVRIRLENEIASRSEELMAKLVAENAKMETYAAELDTLDQHARVLVGEVARDNFVRVEQRLKDVVLRADVGIVQKAWEIREEQRHRLTDLQRERAKEEAFINDELREVLDDAEDNQ